MKLEYFISTIEKVGSGIYVKFERFRRTKNRGNVGARIIIRVMYVQKFRIYIFRDNL